MTGSGQTQPTKDRVTVYETEGNVKPIKRLHRKSKQEIMELAKQNGGKSKKSTKKKETFVKRKTFSIDISSSDATRVRGRGSKKPAAVLVARPKSTRVSARTSVRQSHSPSVQFFADEDGYSDDEEEEEVVRAQQGRDMDVDEDYQQQEEQQHEHGESEEGSGSLNSTLDSHSNGNDSSSYQQYLPTSAALLRHGSPHARATLPVLL